MSGQQKDVIAVRGLDTELYNKIHARAKETGKNVSELMNDAMKLYLNQVLQHGTVYGDGMVSLRVSKNDLVNFGKVTIRGVTDLGLSEDVDKETVENHLVSIENCVNVNVPQPIFADVMKRVRNCINVQSYLVGTTNNQATNIIRIGGIQSLEISKEDLESLDKKVVLEDIEELKLGPQIDLETVNKHIEVIRDVQELTVPKSIFMLILTKVRDCEEVKKY